MKLREIINEKSRNVVKDIVAELQSSDFNMGKPPNDGNGYAQMKSGKIVFQDSYFYKFNAHPEAVKKEWGQPGGTYYEYFFEKYGVKLNVDSVTDVENKKAFKGMSGYFEYVISVQK